MITAQLKMDIETFNRAYRNGEPLVSDEQYDDMLENLKSVESAEGYAQFLRSLTESGGEVSHAYVVGSLKKVKYGEGQLRPWLDKYCQGDLLAMAKIDGASYVTSYVNGVFVKGASRGDGTTGRDWSGKLARVLPKKLARAVSMDIRGEVTLTGNDHLILGMKNRRNGTVGIMNRDDAETCDVEMIRGYAYQIKGGEGSQLPVAEQLKLLRSLGFLTPAWVTIRSENLGDDLEQKLADTMNRWRTVTEPYDIDGLVVCSTSYLLEDEYHPTGMVAFKINQDAVRATVTGIEWNVSKAGLVKPVILIDPVEIDGTTVSRITGNNADWLLEMGVDEGAVIAVVKSGMIIPKCVEVYSRAKKVAWPGECPYCNTPLDKQGVDLVCNNDECGGASVKEIESFLVKMDVEGAKATTLENLGIRSFDDLLAWRADRSYKSQLNLEQELDKKIFHAPAGKIFAALLFDGFGRKLVNRLIEFYGNRMLATAAIQAVVDGVTPSGGFPEGFTSLNMSKAANSWFNNLEMTGRICSDFRYREPAEEIKVIGGKLEGKSFLFTGTLSMNRKAAEKMVVDNGGSVASSVSKNLSYLVAGESAGSKLDKATKLGVAVLTEEEFKAMVA